MTSDLPKKTIRIDPELLAKIEYIANFECRTFSLQVKKMLQECVEEYEREHGTIKID